MRNNQDKSTRIVYTALVVSRLIIIFGIRWVFFKTRPQPTQAPSDVGTGDLVEIDEGGDKRYYIDQGVILRGEISKLSDFNLYSHAFVDSEGIDFGLKSASTDLNAYDGEVSIKGTVTDVIEGLPIIKVDEIISETIDEALPKLEADSSFHIIESAGLVIDLGPTQGFTVQETSEDIKIVDINGEFPEEVLSISSFGCDTSNNLTDCETLIKNFNDIGAESFTSRHGITYTNMTETNTRLAFDGQGTGYYIRPSGEKNLTNFVDLIYFINDGVLEKEILDEAKTSCKPLEAKLGSIQDLESTIGGDGLAQITLTGISADTKNLLICKYQAKIGSSISFQHLSTVVQDNPEYESNEEIEEEMEVENDVDTEVDDDVVDDMVDDVTAGINSQLGTGDSDGNTAVVVDEGEYAGQLSFASARGYTLYFSDKGVGYAGGYLEGDDILTLGDTSCSYGVKVTAWKNIDNVQDAPDSIIYECGGNIELASLPAGVSYIKELNGKHFVKKDITQKYVGMEVGVVGK